MTKRDLNTAPAWLVDFQRRFGAMLTTPLDRSSGTLRARVEAYDSQLVERTINARTGDAREGLSVYHRQYWFRLFEVLQTTYPLTARLLGYWSFNEVVEQFLRASPPRSWDIDHVPVGFDSYLRSNLSRLVTAQWSASLRSTPDVLVDAAKLDSTWRTLFFATIPTPFQPSAADASRLLGARLILSPAVALIQETWPLLDLRKQIAQIGGEGAISVPDRRATPQWFALLRHPQAIVQVELAEQEARLLELLGEYRVEEALGILEQQCPDSERDELPQYAQRWLARSVKLGMWSGLTFADEGEAR